MPRETDRHGGNVFDFISAGDLIVLAVAAVITAVVITATQWWRQRSSPGESRSQDDS